VADDGYATFAALIAIRALQERGIPHPRCVVLIEACEESGSEDLPFYIGRLAARIGIPELVVCLDASCGSYDRIWCTTSLRGVLNGLLRVDVLTEGVHSGDASGIVPSSFRVLRQLLARIEDTESGRVLPAFLQAALPDSAIDDARQVADALGEQVHARFPFAGGTRPATPDGTELILNGTRRPTLSVIGADGLPPPASAGNVLRPFSVLMLSLRLSPGVDADAASRGLKELLENDSPCNAAVSFTVTSCAPGWLAPAMTPTLRNAIDAASCRHFGRPAAYMGDGGSIPFMHMLGERFPRAQFFITGLLGPGSNAHGPNEFMHIPTVKKLTACVAEVIAAHRD
jgi:acetylornithine deacetylase/succinyl-diaminopimelate desuccinylase-like protein